MHLESLTLHNFKNFTEITSTFNNDILCILGENGSGKTNLLDAIHYLSFGKSAFNPQDSQNIRHENSYFSIQGNITMKGENFSIQCSLRQGQKKMLKVNGVECEKLSDHVGRFPLVLIAPDDSDLVREHSDSRRKFVDSLLSQFNRDYLECLIQYNHYLKQRNAALKEISERKSVDRTLFEVYDKHLIELGKKIFFSRNQFAGNFKPFLNSYYQEISGGKEVVSLTYQSSLEQKEFENKFKSNLRRDIQIQRTELGIHRDDFIFKINSHPLKKFGSQGQQKSFIISLKFAQYDFLKEEKKIAPLLLMDDIFDKLDDGRIAKLMQIVGNGNFGQIFITDAREKRTRDIMKKAKVKASFFCIEDNRIEVC